MVHFRKIIRQKMQVNEGICVYILYKYSDVQRKVWKVSQCAAETECRKGEGKEWGLGHSVEGASGGWGV